jgi:endonuclease YncB( thermonuclease family)
MRLGVLVLLVTLLAAGSVEARPGGSFTKSGTVTYVVDGDTLEVALSGGGRERIRLIGIDTPERGGCYAARATAHARRLALGRRVVLKGDPTQDTRDRYRRLLAYVWLPGGKDLGYQLLSGGFAKVYVYRNAFQRLGAYRRAEQAASGADRGVWSCGAPPPATDCHPSYSPCLPVTGDLDCADVRALGRAPVRVLGDDPYRLDGDGDGLGCE